MIWTILGVSVGVVAIFCIAVGELACGEAFFEDHRQYISLALGLGGVGLWSFGRWKAVQPAKTEETLLVEGGEPAGKTYFLRTSQYWGVIVIVFGLVAFFIQPLRQKAAPAIIAAVAVPARPPVKLPPLAPVEFPKMKMQGVNTSISQPSATINGQLYFVGDKVGAAVVTAIDQNSATLELSGQTKVLYLQK